MTPSSFGPDATAVVNLFRGRSERLVLAESCTGGALAAAITAVPGASSVLVGSFVTYRVEAKRDWLGLGDGLLERVGTVAGETSEAMATAALHSAPSARRALAVTGHLGPDAPEELDGRVFIAVAVRDDDRVIISASRQLRLQEGDRRTRQMEATAACMAALAEV